MLAAIVSVSGYSLSIDEKKYLKDFQPLGISLFTRNIRDKKQLKNLIDEIKYTMNRDDVLVAVDQEGGRVRRLKEPDFHAMSSQFVLGQLGEDISRLHAKIISQDLSSVGINFNYAPCLDIAYPYTHQVLGSRCLGSDKEKIAKLGAVMIDEYIKNSICPCIKHIPGHGRAETDPHLGLPVLKQSLKDLETDFYPFIHNNHSPAGMTAHIVIPELDDKPITMSQRAITEIIRGKIDFRGLLISDAIDMKALKGTTGEKALAVINAGCDVVCYCGGDFREMLDLADNCPKMSDKSLFRFEKIKDIISMKTNVAVVDFDKYYSAIGQMDEYDETYDATETLNKMRR